jgi:hypothetical protein
MLWSSVSDSASESRRRPSCTTNSRTIIGCKEEKGLHCQWEHPPTQMQEPRDDDDEEVEVHSAHICYSKKESLSTMEQRICDLHELLQSRQVVTSLSYDDEDDDDNENDGMERCIISSPSGDLDEDDMDQSTTTTLTSLSSASVSSSSPRRPSTKRRVVTVVTPYPTNDCRYYFYSSLGNTNQCSNDASAANGCSELPSLAGSSVSTVSAWESNSTSSTCRRMGIQSGPLVAVPPPLMSLLPRTRTYIQLATPSYGPRRASNDIASQTTKSQRDNGWGYFVDAKEEEPFAKLDGRYRSFLKKELDTAPKL